MTEETSSQRMTSRDIKAQERRQQILAVAKKMFAAGGYHATSMRSLNKEIGVAEALTYHYFPGGKLEILQTIIQEGRDAQIANIEALMPQFKDDLPLREALSFAAHMGTDLFSADKELIQILMRERNWLFREEWIRAVLPKEPPTAFLMDYFEKRMAQGEIRKIDLGFAFYQFFSGIVMHSLFGDEAGTGDSDDQKYIEKLVDFTAQMWSP
jgi:AcrR family transcriptional regulator